MAKARSSRSSASSARSVKKVVKKAAPARGKPAKSLAAPKARAAKAASRPAEKRLSAKAALVKSMSAKPAKVKKSAASGPVAGRDADGKIAAFAKEAAQLMDDLKCTDVLVMDVRGKSQVTDYIVVASGTSDRQMRSVAQTVAELAEQRGHPPYRSNADTRTTWVIMDCVDVVVHLFEPNTRLHYDLEMMWGDAPRISWAGTRTGPLTMPGKSSVRDESTAEV